MNKTINLNKKKTWITSIIIFSILIIIVASPYIINFARNIIAVEVHKHNIYTQEQLAKEKSNALEASRLYSLALNQAFGKKKQDFDGAKKSLEKAVNILNSGNKSKHTKILAQCTAQLAYMNQIKGNLKEAEKLYFNAINIAKSNEKENYQVLADCYNRLASFYIATEINNKMYIENESINEIKQNPKLKDIENNFNSAIELIKKYESEKSPKINDYLYTIAEYYYRPLGMYDKAEPIYLKLISQKDKKYFVQYLNRLISFYIKENETKKAENLLINNIDILGDKNFIDNYLKYSDRTFVYEVYLDLADIYENKKDYKKSEYFKKIALAHY